MSLVLNVEILGEFKQLTAATKGAQNSLNSLNKRTKAISNGMNRAFAAIGVGFSLGVIKRELEESAKAAVEDSKSMNILALAMENAAGATKAQVAQAESSIRKMQFQAGVADDELRPAFQKLFIATKDVTASNKLLQIALDASAATGKGLDAVSQAMAKSLAGSDTALIKLIPSLKGAKDPMAELEKTFKGAAAEAANTDPYQRMQIIFGEMQEQIGMALLPTLNKLSTWLATPEGQAKLQGLIDLVVALIGDFTVLLGWVVDNKEAFLLLAGVVGTLTLGLKAYNIVQSLTTTGLTAMGVAAKSTLGILGAVLAAWEAIDAISSGIKAGGGFPALPSNSPGNTFLGSTAQPSAGGSNMVITAPKTAAKTTVVNNNIKIVGTQSAQQIAQTLNKQLAASGSSTIIRGGR